MPKFSRLQYHIQLLFFPFLCCNFFVLMLLLLLLVVVRSFSFDGESSLSLSLSLSLSFLDICSLSVISRVCIVFRSINLSSYLIHFKNGPEYLTKGAAQVFISLMRFLLQVLLLKSLLDLLRDSFLVLFFSFRPNIFQLFVRFSHK